MIRRYRFNITAIVACHLLLAPWLFTSQLPHPAAHGDAEPSLSQEEQPGAAPAAAPEGGEEVLIRAREQEKSGSVFRLRGEAEITFREFVFRADEVTYDASSGEITAAGNVLLEGGPHGERIQASHARYNVRTDSGEFFDVTGSTSARFVGKDISLTTPSPFTFTGRRVEKTGSARYVVYDGSITSCELPTPKWTFNAARAVVELDDKASLYHSTFRIRGVPVLYFPYAAHPVGRKRQSGFLIPTFGTSTRKGTIFGESLYWAINRSLDATVGAEYWSARGWAQHGEFRARPSESSHLRATYFGVLDRATVDQGGQEVHLDAEAEFPRGFRGVASLNYLSSFVFRLAFEETFAQAVNSEVKSLAFLSKTYRGFSFNSLAARYQNFQSTVPGDLITIWHAPSFEFSSVDRALGRSPVYWSVEAAAEAVSRKEPAFSTNDLVGRLDLHPRASIPLHLGGWSVRPEIGLRDTFYTQRRLPTGGIGVPGDEAVNRRAFEVELEVRPPALARTFAGTVNGRTLRHVMEPRFTYRYVNGVSNFPNIIRFDARDILSDTSEIEYGVVQRLYAKRAAPPPDCPSPAPAAAAEPGGGAAAIAPPPLPEAECERGAREILTWELKQKYFFSDDFGGTVVNGKRNVFTTTASFAGIAVLTEPRRFSPLVSRLRVRPTGRLDAEWELDYD
ncbi:MAG: LPS-assembly protein LptD, partial [Terriglobales bacterium]